MVCDPRSDRTASFHIVNFPRFVLMLSLGALVAWLNPSRAEAASFAVSFNDANVLAFEGVVDTDADTFTVETWFIPPQAQANEDTPWTLTSLPSVWNAVDSTGATYDVPDNWDATIGLNWGFLPPGNNASLGWAEGVPTLERTIGWGAGVYSSGLSTGSNELSIQALPSAAGTVRGANISHFNSSDSLLITAVPEPGTGAMLLVGLLYLHLSRRHVQG